MIRLLSHPLLALLVPLLVLALPRTAAAQDMPNPYYSENVETFSYGLYCSGMPDDVVEAPGTAAGVVNMIETPEFFAATTLVPAELDLGFGVLVLMAPGAVMDPVEITITHPPYPDSGIEVEHWNTSLDDVNPGLVGFSFDSAVELLPGDWVIEGAHKGETQFRITFTVVPPALAPELSGRCLGTFMS